jgi:hypothetical protein
LGLRRWAGIGSDLGVGLPPLSAGDQWLPIVRGPARPTDPNRHLEGTSTFRPRCRSLGTRDTTFLGNPSRGASGGRGACSGPNGSCLGCPTWRLPLKGGCLVERQCASSAELSRNPQEMSPAGEGLLRRDAVVQPCLAGEACRPVPVASLPARGRPPQAAARRAGLEKSRGSCNERNDQRIDRPPLGKQSPSCPSRARWWTAVSAVASAAGGWVAAAPPTASADRCRPAGDIGGRVRPSTADRASSSAASANVSRSVGLSRVRCRRRPARMRQSCRRSCPRRCGSLPLQ